MGRNRTNPDTPAALSPQQETAVDLLASGKNITDAAAVLAVGRPTVSFWLHHDPCFQVALNRRRQELWHEITATLRGMVPQALQVLQDALDVGDQRFAAAVTVLKASGAWGFVPAPGPTELDEAILEAEERAAERTRRKEDALLRGMSLIESTRYLNERLG